MKNALTTPLIFSFPDFTREFILDTDASFDTIGAVLSQKDDEGHERVIAYGSHAMSNHEKGYCIFAEGTTGDSVFLSAFQPLHVRKTIYAEDRSQVNHIHDKD